MSINNRRILSPCMYYFIDHSTSMLVMYTDTTKSGVMSNMGNIYCQFSQPFGWVRDFPILKKLCAYDALSLLFKRDGVPAKKEQVFSNLKKKLKGADCHQK